MSDVADRLRALADAATPGPWEASEGMFPIVKRAGSFAPVMEFAVYGNDGREEAAANSRLVALAPELARGYADALDALALANYFDVTTDRLRCIECHSDGGCVPECPIAQLLAEAGRLLGDK